MVVVPITGSPPMPTNAEMPSPACTRLRHSSVPSEPERETTPILPGRNTRVLNAGMKPTKHSPTVTMPAVFGPITLAPRSRAAASTYIVSCTGTCSVRQTILPMPASMMSSAASFTPNGGMNITAASMAVSRAASPAVAHTGKPRCVSPARFGLTPPMILVP